MNYTAKPGEILNTLHFQWEVDEQFEGDYRKDYQSLHNELIEDVRTAWVDKYTAAIYTRDEDANCRRYELQPIPDYLRWYKTGEPTTFLWKRELHFQGPGTKFPECTCHPGFWTCASV